MGARAMKRCLFLIDVQNGTGDGSSIEVNIHRADLSPDFVAEIIGTDANGQKQAYRVRRDLDNIARDLLFIHHRHIGAAGLPDIFNSLKE